MTDTSRCSRSTFLKVAGAAMLASTLPGSPSFAAAAPLAMRPIPKSKTKEQLPVIGLGTSQVFASRGDAAAMTAKGDVVKTLLQEGGRVIDTAAAYRESEGVVGDLLEPLTLRKQAFVATKFGEQSRDNGIASIARSFKNLRTDMIDLMYIHNMVDVDTHLPTIKQYKADGKFRYIGISDTSNNQDKLTTWMDQIDFVEFNYSVDTREAEKRLLPMAKDKGVAVFVALPLGRGRLLNRVKDTPFPEWAKAELQCATFAQLLLKFVVSHPAVTTAIPATSRQKHVGENLDAGRGPLPDAKQRERIAAIWNA